jgi:hypothetical protein
MRRVATAEVRSGSVQLAESSVETDVEIRCESRAGPVKPADRVIEEKYTLSYGRFSASREKALKEREDPASWRPRKRKRSKCTMVESDWAAARSAR